jgi:hypothetical protein
MAQRSGRLRRRGARAALAVLLAAGGVAAAGCGAGDGDDDDVRRPNGLSGQAEAVSADHRRPPGAGADRPGPAAPDTTGPAADGAGGAGAGSVGGRGSSAGAPGVTPGDVPRWRPTAGLSWQWQLDGEPIDTSVDAEVYDVDLFTTPAETIRRLHDDGRRVICYFTAGTWEPYRPDAGDYAAEVIGGPVEGWPEERWVDIRRLDLLRPIMAARLDLCAAKGADGAEPDWMDNHTQDTGWDITAADQLAFNRMIADLAHERGLAVGLKNDLGQAAELADEFDFAVVEQCAEFGECGALRPFLDRGKPVFHAEYDLPTSAFCAESRQLGLSSIRKRLELDAWREAC